MLPSRSERGQVLVLILIALVGLLGFAALVVDGGHLYNERRRAQSAADAAALAAASAGSRDKTESEIASIVSAQARDNGFLNGSNNTIVTYYHPPVSGPYSIGPDKDQYFQVFITQDVPPIFSQFVFQGTQQVTVEAIARARPSIPLTGNNAMMAMATCSCGPAIKLDGGVEMTIRGGRVFTNDGGVRDTNGGGGGIGDVRIYKDPDPAKNEQGDVVYYGAWDEKQRNKMYANFIMADKTVALDKVPAPYCPVSDVKDKPPSNPPLQEYDAERNVHYYLWDGATMTRDMAKMGFGAELPPGIHCVIGDLSLQDRYKALNGTGVLLVLEDGGFISNGGATVDLTRADSLIDKNGNQWGGMVIFAPYDNDSRWNFGGNSITTFNGTLLAPGSHCDLGGTPENQDIHSAFVCADFDIKGNTHINITYVPEENWQLPPSLSLVH